MKKIILKILIFSAFLLGNIDAQTNNEIENEIKSQLQNKFETVYRIGALVNVDEEKNQFRDFKFPVSDPYNTLKDCYIFVAYVSSGVLVGVYRNGSIIWNTEADISPGVTDDIYGTKDLNNDGNVEIMVSMYYGMRNSSQSIWIFSWNGIAGSLLNEVKPYGEKSRSVIFSFDWFTDILDTDGDGIMEIKGQDESTRKTKIYSWNGSKYGAYGVQMPQYVPRDLLSAAVKCEVKKSQYGLLYNYTVHNDSTSKQAVWRFAVDRNFENTFNNSAAPSEKWIEKYPQNLTQWEVNFDQQVYPFDYILPNQSRKNFRLETNELLISIVNFYIQGKNGMPPDNNENLFRNSFIGRTICGRQIPSPFISLDFIDTLQNYTSHSLELGWIKEETVADKYANYFTSAKTELLQNNITAVHNTLNSVLRDVETDSGSVLTSEAYALLRYNTEYLLENLPGKKNKEL